MKARVNIYTATNGYGVRRSDGKFIVIVEFIPRNSSEPATKTIKRYIGQVSSNQLELAAVVAGMECLTRPCEVTIYTGSGYVRQTLADNRLEKWYEDGWKNAKKERIKNCDLWQKLHALMSVHDVYLAPVTAKAHTYAGYMLRELDNIAEGRTDVHNGADHRE